ncbi:UBP-type zinc finger domain-containing protein [Streptomyces sp. B8F3]|uniref:UBP-type zinc finger domain-containing protein n=1 Tax=unclassified Streptomyces TaxID=2593676 RepID=UPI00325CAFE1
MDAERMSGIDPASRPSGEGCAGCMAGEGPGWWFHLRRCAACGRIGCCDSSPSQHASRHARESGHPVLTSFEPGEDWFWNADTGQFVDGPEMSPPQAHPVGQPVPGPAGKVPSDWQQHLH